MTLHHLFKSWMHCFKCLGGIVVRRVVIHVGPWRPQSVLFRPKLGSPLYTDDSNDQKGCTAATTCTKVIKTPKPTCDTAQGATQGLCVTTLKALPRKFIVYLPIHPFTTHLFTCSIPPNVFTVKCSTNK